MKAFTRSLISTVIIISALVIAPYSAFGLENTVSPMIFENMQYRSVGPFRGGRSVAVTGVKGNPQLYYMGTTGGGVWKSENAGGTWSPLSDKDFAVGSIGSIAVAPL